MQRAELLTILFAITATLGCGGDDDDDKGGKGGMGGQSAGGQSSGGQSSGGQSSGGQSSGGQSAGGSAGSASGGSAGTGTGGSGGAPIPPPVADDCITDVSAKADHVFDCSGLKWNVSVPGACVQFACGVIFDVHGFSMSGAIENANTKLKELGAQHGFIVVQPNADPAPPLSNWIAGTDDPKVLDFIQRVTKAFHTDAKRLHFTGFSQGGDMTWRFICNHSDIIASAAPSAFGHSAEENCFSEGKAPPREMPMLYMHGNKDAIVSFSTAEAARDAIVQVLAMSEKPAVSSDAMHQWKRWENAKGTRFEFIEHGYTGSSFPQGHCFPGSTDPSPLYKCQQQAAFVWGEAVMQFFLAHTMP